MATWQRGQAWRVVGSLQTLNAQLRERYQRAAPPATPASSWGSIADDAHSSGSDHYPHYYAALGKTAVVCARDFPHAASLGMDGGIITETLRLSRDPRIAYVIFAGRIFSSTTRPWEWRKYDGSDGHWTHFHVSSVHTVAADNTRPWALPGAAMTGDDDMTWNQGASADAVFNNKPSAELDTSGAGDGTGPKTAFPNHTYNAIQELKAKIAELEAAAGLPGEGGGLTADQARAIAREEIAAAKLTPGDG